MEYPSFAKTEADKAAFDVAVEGEFEEWVYGVNDLRAIENGCYFDIDQALYVKDYIETYCFVSPHQPMILYPWQWTHIIAPIFGWCNSNGHRRYNYAWIEIPKKNGKSILCSAISLYMAFGDSIYSAKAFNAAYSKAQAGQVFDAAANMARLSPLVDNLRIVPTTKIINCPELNSSLRAISRESSTSEGLDAHAIVMDEVHAWKSRKLFDSLRYGTAAKKKALDGEPGNTSLMMIITTAGGDQAHFSYDLHCQAKDVIEGRWINESIYAYIAAADPSDDWRLEATHRKANPSYDHSLDIKQFQDDFEQAKKYESAQWAFRRYRLNQWIGDSDESWINPDDWNACDGGDKYKPEEFTKRNGIGSLDLASVSDLCCLTLAFEDDEGVVDFRPYFWVPEETAKKREDQGEAPYFTWINQGHIEKTPGNGTDYDYIEQRVIEICNAHSISEVTIDGQWNGEAFAQHLIKAGINVTFHAQGFKSMSLPAKRFEVLIKQRKIRHGGNPILKWMSGNCKLVTDRYDGVRPVKKSANKKIDGIVCCVMATSVLTADDGTADPNDVYSEPGTLLVL